MGTHWLSGYQERAVFLLALEVSPSYLPPTKLKYYLALYRKVYPALFQMRLTKDFKNEPPLSPCVPANKQEPFKCGHKISTTDAGTPSIIKASQQEDTN